ncbi:hypothetical protein KVR01_009236 [Diaporthe batatas]|uniref:uncharacterized protein n=1 Tax=Diaporthe batatas TaxID=748121 RepID=UPI001D055687|nr:uncharacterized protein KVR01_009236 [Diaporthe batatas]KAG8160972.1 hypothetical protein KVR01_009236 [Diaporthe batatas]
MARSFFDAEKMPIYSPVRYTHCGRGKPQPLSLDASVHHQMKNITNSYDLTQSTPRSMKGFDRLYLDDIVEKIGGNIDNISPSPAQTVVPRDFDVEHEWHEDGIGGWIDPNTHRRRSEPQMIASHAYTRHGTSFRPRYRHSSPRINYESGCGKSPSQHPTDSRDELLSPRDKFRKESDSVSLRLHDIANDGSLRLEQLNRKVLLAMETQSLGRRRSSAEMSSESSHRRDSEQGRFIGGHDHPVRSALASEYIPPDPGKPLYRPLTRPEAQIRLFNLARIGEDGKIKGSFVYADIHSCPKYTALSYAWGETTATRTITIEGQDDVDIGENLWWFLHCRGLTMKKARLFWIDAVCINQGDVQERNHQVSLMKRIFSKATSVYIWLGNAFDNSQVAMDFLGNTGMKPLRLQVHDQRPIWGSQEGRAIRDLFQRPYWSRMWIIQEIIHANRLTVWCGPQRVEWPVLDRLYLTMKTLEEENQLSNHAFAAEIRRSPAFVMVWQRAHWRHPETPTPKLQTLIETFQGWECTDIRDKVYALQIYQDVLRQGSACDNRFRKLLAGVLGVSSERQQ